MRRFRAQTVFLLGPAVLETSTFRTSCDIRTPYAGLSFLVKLVRLITAFLFVRRADSLLVYNDALVTLALCRGVTVYPRRGVVRDVQGIYNICGWRMNNSTSLHSNSCVSTDSVEPTADVLEKLDTFAAVGTPLLRYQYCTRMIY